MKCKPTCVAPSIGSKQQHCGICHETFAAPSVGDDHKRATIHRKSGTADVSLRRLSVDSAATAILTHCKES